jgi:cephalosporin hydroxylase
MPDDSANHIKKPDLAIARQTDRSATRRSITSLRDSWRARWISRRLPRLGPPPVEFPLSGRPVDYWTARVKQHTLDSYAGIGLAKFPEDLRAYEHIIWAQAPSLIVEIGTSFGASALWFRDRLRTLETYGRVANPRVVSIDLDVEPAQRNLSAIDPAFDETIHLIAWDVRDPALPAVVAKHIPRGSRCLVIEDSAHRYETTAAALAGFARFVQPGGFFVVEDGYVDIEDRRTDPTLPRGVLPAIRDWLRTPEGRCFAIHRGMEMYGFSSHPEGFLFRLR